MKLFTVIVMLGLFACSDNKRKDATVDNRASENAVVEESKSDSVKAQRYSNTRFRDVTVARVGSQFTIRGEAQIFEANFGWAVEDGHQELKNGFEMTDAGAPEWGKFEFTIEVEKTRPNSTLTLVLFESSAKDGSRQYELPLVLE